MKNISPKILRLARRAKWLRAFTLIELLVVVAIIGILVALTVPAVNSAKSAALNAKTMGRMRKLGAGYLSYMADHDNTVPLITQTNPNASDAVGGQLQPMIGPYLGLPELTNNNKYGPLWISTVWWNAFAEINGTRSPNGDLYNANTAWPGGPPQNKLAGMYFINVAHTTYTDTNGDLVPGLSRLTQIYRPSKTAVLFDRRLDYYPSGTSNVWNCWSDGRKFSATNPPSYGAKRIIFYFDGHTETWNLCSTNYNAEWLFSGWANN